MAQGSLTREDTVWKVFVNGKLDNELRVLSVEESVGFERLDTAVLAYDKFGTATKSGKLSTIEHFELRSVSTEIEIVRNMMGFPNEQVVHWGKVQESHPRIAGSDSGMKIVSRTERFHFGNPFVRVPVWNPKTGKMSEVDTKPIVNPVIDGKTEGNQHPTKMFAPGNYSAFLDPESTRTDASVKWHGGKPVEWSLVEIVYALCWILNGRQQYIVNPTKAELANVLSTASVVRDFEIPQGKYLPEILSRLLVPLGYRWHVEKPRQSHRQLRFLRRGRGKYITFKHQIRGSNLDIKKTEVEVCAPRYDTSRAINAVICRGSYLEAEFTDTLQKAWDAKYDNVNRQDLESSVIEENPEHRDVYRKYVLNEAGDYTGLRPEITTPATELLFKPLTPVPRRLKLRPCLTLGDDGAPIGQVRGIVIEYSDPNTAGKWIAADTAGIQILEQEAGIRFSGAMPPEILLDQRAYGNVRVTASVRFDQRLFGVAAHKAASVQTDDNTVVIDADDMFHYRKVSKYSQFWNTGRKTLERDDRIGIEAYAEGLRRLFDSATVGGRIALEGTDRSGYQLGDHVTEVEGISVDLRGNPGQTPRIFPQIVRIKYDLVSKTTVLDLEQIRARNV